MKNIIFHVDVNSAFLSWEATYRLHHKGGTLDIRTVPSAVGGDMSIATGSFLQNQFRQRNTVSPQGNHTGSKEEMPESFTGTAELRYV